MNYAASDRAYVDVHRLVFGEPGRRLATSAILFRDRLLRPGFILPPIRLAHTATYNRARGQAGRYGFVAMDPDGTPGVWLYLYSQFTTRHPGYTIEDELDEVLLHELVHCELTQFREDANHKGAPWARRCQELSVLLGLETRIERPRSVRVAGRVTTGTPPGCLSYADLSMWPTTLLDGGPPLRKRLAGS